MTDERLTGFPPVWKSDARILILGSMPSVESLRQGFYYAHSRNAFWPMIAEILGESCPETIEEKKALLLRHRIALWDSAQSCERAGSLDSAIRNPQINDFDTLYKHCPRITHVLFNGAAAMRLYGKLPDGDSKKYLRLPSTSPAYTLRYAEKKRLWTLAIEEALSDESL